jgi:hypothetical protein
VSDSGTTAIPTGNILLQRWTKMIIAGRRLPLCSHKRFRFYGYEIFCVVWTTLGATLAGDDSGPVTRNTTKLNAQFLPFNASTASYKFDRCTAIISDRSRSYPVCSETGLNNNTYKNCTRHRNLKSEELKHVFLIRTHAHTIIGKRVKVQQSLPRQAIKLVQSPETTAYNEVL